MDDHKKTLLVQEVSADSPDAVGDLKRQRHLAINASVLASLPDCGTNFRGDWPGAIDVIEDENLLPINEDWVVTGNESLNS